MKAVASTAVAAAVVLLLSGCFGPSPEELVERASADFDSLVEQAAAVDVEVLHTLEVDEPAVEPCDDGDTEHTVLVASGTMAVQADDADAHSLIDGFEPSARDDDNPWTEVTLGVSGIQRAWADARGITASVTVDDGLLVVAVFSPCR